MIEHAQLNSDDVDVEAQLTLAIELAQENLVSVQFEINGRPVTVKPTSDLGKLLEAVQLSK